MPQIRGQIFKQRWMMEIKRFPRLVMKKVMNKEMKKQNREWKRENKVDDVVPGDGDNIIIVNW